ncbi:c-type cytochrome [Undibacterium flavidum]|uniref:C-type cytochrome n=1 Tax=Undibacterium flavidum TaxID=2762297 RepID=A0ABR6YBT5_9BURK|nr:c-type cytochrome [Undibacterium flavidum]MBC3874005.1 c-type cytochrome [Undibacterium flavidum]
MRFGLHFSLKLNRVRQWQALSFIVGTFFLLPQIVLAQKKQASTKSKTTASLQTLRVGNAEAGFAKAENERCMECHGIDGQGHGHVDGAGKIVKFAKLAGQDVAYLFKQIQDFRNGARKDDFMKMMANSINDEDATDILAYFAAQKPMQADTNQQLPNTLGQQLFEQGDSQRGIAACISCHTKTTNEKAVAPRLQGQEWRYLQKQMLDWRSGQRRNDQTGVMSKLLQPLKDHEIDSLASYLSTAQ